MTRNSSATTSPTPWSCCPATANFIIRDNKSAEELVAAIAELVALDSLPQTRTAFYIFTPIKTPLRPQDHPKIEEATDCLLQGAGPER